jgi:hypothetical protein
MSNFVIMNFKKIMNKSSNEARNNNGAYTTIVVPEELLPIDARQDIYKCKLFCLAQSQMASMGSSQCPLFKHVAPL